jgi:DNA repair protein RecO (recombination protein O)
VAHGARRLRSRYGASLEPFTEVAITYFQKENRELVSLSNCEIIRSHFEAATSSEMLGALHYLAELVIEFLPDHEPNERVYRLIGATLAALKQVPRDRPAALVRYFEVWMLKLAGFFPDLRRCAACRRDLAREASVWLAEEGTPRCTSCTDRRGEELRPDVRRMIQEILQHSPEKFVSAPHELRALAQIEAVSARLIRRALERELRSYELLDRLRPGQAA